MITNSEIAQRLRKAADVKYHCDGILDAMSHVIEPEHLKQAQDAVKSINGLKHLFAYGGDRVPVTVPDYRKLLLDTAARLEHKELKAVK